MSGADIAPGEGSPVGTCGRCGGTGAVRMPVAGKPAADLATWANRECFDCRGTGTLGRALSVSQLRELRGELDAAYVAQLAGLAKRGGFTKKQVADMTAGFRDGMSFMLGGLRQSLAVVIVDDEPAEKTIAPKEA